MGDIVVRNSILPGVGKTALKTEKLAELCSAREEMPQLINV